MFVLVLHQVAFILTISVIRAVLSGYTRSLLVEQIDCSTLSSRIPANMRRWYNVGLRRWPKVSCLLGSDHLLNTLCC